MRSARGTGRSGPAPDIGASDARAARRASRADPAPHPAKLGARGLSIATRQRLEVAKRVGGSNHRRRNKAVILLQIGKPCLGQMAERGASLLAGGRASLMQHAEVR